MNIHAIRSARDPDLCLDLERTHINFGERIGDPIGDPEMAFIPLITKGMGAIASLDGGNQTGACRISDTRLNDLHIVLAHTAHKHQF